ncbi:MAG: ATP-grasp domain-containing protein [Kiritimatiellae bacterium]|nr:ATP-grasp domain-containing protein [Kiritimatiellia bacterium]
MLLGGIRYLLPVIEAAHKLGAYVITADYLPDNIAHKYSDEYVNVSIIDRDAVLKVAREQEIDGILSFGVDPGVVTAAYVAAQMGLPFPPLASVEILQNKDRFRDFLEANGFNCPKRYRPTDEIVYPVIVKPVDAAGSKGCSRVDSAAALAPAIEYARSESRNGRIIIEQFLTNAFSSSDTDSFSVDSELVFCSFNCQHFDATAPNPYTPSAYSWPSEMPEAAQIELRSEIQRLIRLLNLGTSIYNIETRVATDGKPYIMELSPRGGGNRLSEVLKLATGQDLIENCVRGALGLPMLPMSDPVYKGSWAEFIVHSNKSGNFESLEIDEDFAKQHLVQNDLWVKAGDKVASFTGANQTIGTLVLKFDAHKQAEKALANSSKWLRVAVDG